MIDCYDKAAEKQENIAEAATEVFDQRRVFHITNRADALALKSLNPIVKNERRFGPLEIV